MLLFVEINESFTTNMRQSAKGRSLLEIMNHHTYIAV